MMPLLCGRATSLMSCFFSALYVAFLYVFATGMVSVPGPGRVEWGLFIYGMVLLW